MLSTITKKALAMFLILTMLSSLLTSCVLDFGKGDDTASAEDSTVSDNSEKNTGSNGNGDALDTENTDNNEPQGPTLPKEKTLDIYLVAGQSNATGCTYISDLNGAYAWASELQDGFSNVLYAGNSRSNGAEPRDRIIDWQKTTMRLGMSANHFGPEAGMAVALSDYYNEESGRYAGIIKYAYGGSSLLNKTNDDTSKDGNWVSPSYQATLPVSQVVGATGQMYRNFLAQVEENVRQVLEQQGMMGDYEFDSVRICGLYWMQGCQDKSQPSEYEKAFTYFAKDIRNDLAKLMKDITNSSDDCGAADMPIIVGTISNTQNLTSLSTESVNRTFIELQKSFATKIENCYVVDNSEYVITKWENGSQIIVGSDQWHWNQNDMLNIGVNVGETMLDSADVLEDTDPVRVIKISNAGQLLTLLADSKAENYAQTSKNKIYQLQNDIDMNKNWSAEILADGDNVTAVPDIPGIVWEGIEKFYGTFDGNGYKIKGLYMYETLADNGTMGFIKELCGGTVKNLTIENSYFGASVDDASQNVCVGALVGKADAASTVENVHMTANMYIVGDDTVKVSGTVASKAGGAPTNCVFDGNIYLSVDDISVIKVYTAQELLDAFTQGGNLLGKTIRLMNDIDLNPNWSAAVSIDTSIVFPTMPSTVWPNIATFMGTLDGNGYTLKGIYSSKNVSGNRGAYGGLFNTLDGGTVKNLKIENSFVLVTNSDWANDYNVHVGGIAGDVNAGSVLDTIYLDAEVWFKSWDGCVLGGAFGHANGQYTVNGFAFAGRVGNTGLGNNLNYASTSKKVFLAQITGNQNNKEDSSVRNSVCAGEIYTGNNSATHVHLGINFPWHLKFVLDKPLDAAWLASRTDYQDAGFVYCESVGYAVPGEIAQLLNGVSQ